MTRRPSSLLLMWGGVGWRHKLTFRFGGWMLRPPRLARFLLRVVAAIHRDKHELVMRGGHRAEHDKEGSAAVSDAFLPDAKRVTALIGPYGSGKTELAITLALDAAARKRKTGISEIALVDLDVLKPYFRSREAGAILAAAGVRLIAPLGALAEADLPIVPAEARGMLSRTDVRTILDVGGDPVGARALGSLSDVVGAAEYDLLLVINRNRPFADSRDSVVSVAREIVAACKLQVTGIVSNTHMVEETTVDDVRWGLDLSRQVAAALKVDVRLVMVPEGLEGIEAVACELPPVVTVRRHMRPVFQGGVVLNTARLPLGRQAGSQ
jgi:hypothetical protein